MEGYPSHLVSHNIPFIVLFGLGSTASNSREADEEDYPLLQEKGVYISSELPSITGAIADDLIECFQDFDAKDAAWNNRPGKGKMGTMGFTYRNVGRVGQITSSFCAVKTFYSDNIYCCLLSC